MSEQFVRASLRLWRWRYHRHHAKLRKARQADDHHEINRVGVLVQKDLANINRRLGQLGELSDGVEPPLKTVLADSWGYHPPVHDGIDLICPKDARLFAMCDGEVVRADSGGWWGKAPSGNVALGDGIIIIRCTINSGPFKPGLNICYGHAEKAKVKPGDKVKAGDYIGHAGLAVAWHVHLMVNGRTDTRGVGDRDPEPYYAYARDHAD